MGLVVLMTAIDLLSCYCQTVGSEIFASLLGPLLASHEASQNF